MMIYKLKNQGLLFLATLAAILIFNNSGFAQTVEGKVYGLNNEGKAESLYGANLFWLDTFVGTVTDENGEFSIEYDNDYRKLVVSFIGYITDTIDYKENGYIEITLSSVHQIQNAEIIGKKKDTDLSLINPINIQTIGQGELCKAACCNLSESFETNASVDAAYTDAITGTRQIRMLGLDGKYTQIMADNIPNVRGLSTIYGLSYIPGPWIEKIYVSKGVGSVVNGYESITGQINVALKNANISDKVYANIFGSSDGRVEFNSIHTFDVSEKIKTNLMVHSEWADQRFDKNNDGFIDSPLKKDLILRNTWNYKGELGWRGSYALGVLISDQIAGQKNYHPDDEINTPLWGAHLAATKYDLEAKVGYIIQDKPQSSFGSQFNFSLYDLDNQIGIHQYNGLHTSGRANILYASYLKKEEHKYTVGLSYQLDDYQEDFDSISINRFESVPGAFVEYNYNNLERFAVILGLRGDHHNLFGFFVSPRAHLRYSINEHISVKAVAGSGWRTPNVFMENIGYMASSREWNMQGMESYGYKPEEAANFGLNYTHKFTLNHRDASLTFDAYHTRFQNQLVTDLDASSREVNFYNLDGESYSNSVQTEFYWEMNKRMEVKMAYRWLEVWTDYSDELRQTPFTSKNRAFVNLTYKTKEKDNGSRWLFNTTTQYVGSQRLPFTNDKGEQFQLPSNSEEFVTINGQVNYFFNKKFDAYIGIENAANYRQINPIIDSENPFSDEFDASFVWAPVFGRMYYFGINFQLSGSKDNP